MTTRLPSCKQFGVTIALALALSGCGREDGFNLTGGRVTTGRQLIFSFACGSCHAIPGVSDATGTLGPPLRGFGYRTYIAGSLVNTPENLFLWVRHPQQFDPGTAMPDLGVSEEQARHIAAYLYTLR